MSRSAFFFFAFICTQRTSHKHIAYRADVFAGLLGSNETANLFFFRTKQGKIKETWNLSPFFMFLLLIQYPLAEPVIIDDAFFDLCVSDQLLQDDGGFVSPPSTFFFLHLE